MDCTALDVGTPVGTELAGTGRVVGVSRNVFNIELTSGLCLSITSEDLDKAPNRIRLTRQDFARLTINVGDLMFVEKFIVQNSTVAISFDLSPRQESLTSITIGNDALVSLAHVLLSGPGVSRFYFGVPSETSLDTAILNRIREFEANPELAWRLIGLGHGLTPTGDDLLTGFLAVGSLIGKLPNYLYLEIISRAFNLTNSLSATSLYFAGQGLVQDYLACVLSRLSGSRRELEDAACRLRDRVGSTSGNDTLLGVFLACKVLGKHATRGDTFDNQSSSKAKRI